MRSLLRTVNRRMLMIHQQKHRLLVMQLQQFFKNPGTMCMELHRQWVYRELVAQQPTRPHPASTRTLSMHCRGSHLWGSHLSVVRLRQRVTAP